MKRSEFLIGSGLLLTSAMLAGYTAKEHSQPVDETDGKLRRPDVNKFKDPILQALTYGLNAPNPHNTQAWKFQILNSREALLYVDEKRILPATDPPTRQIHIGCGCFIALFEIGATSLGFKTVTDLFPEGEYPLSDIGKKPAARLRLEPTQTGPDKLFGHIYSRQTNRLKYEGELISLMEFSNIDRLASPIHTTTRLINDHGTLPPVLELLYKGMEVECNDWKAYDESRQWFRVKGDILNRRDGINLRVNGMNGIKRWIAETMLSDYSKKTWHNETSINSYLKTHYDAMMSSKGVVLFTTASNTPTDWLRCGIDYARFQLAAFDQGFFVQPLSQVLQEFPSMAKLQNDFNQMMNIASPAKAQMVVRIGRSKPTEFAYRRDTNDFITNS